MTDTIRHGYIGVAGIAKNHAGKLSQVPGVVHHAAADIEREPLDAFAERFEVLHRHLDYREMLADPELDSVSVCTPNKFHCEPTIAALEAGKHVIVEKPMGRNVDECRRMIDAANASGSKLVVGFQWRFNPQARFIRQQARAGALGRILHARVHALRRRNVPSWGVFGNLEAQGGGAMIDFGVHLVEMALSMMGDPQPVAVSAQTFLEIANRPNEVLCPWGDWDHATWETEDLATAFVRFADGATMHIESSFAAHIEKNRANVEIMGTEGGARYEPLSVFTDLNGYMVDVTPNYIGKEDGFAEKMRFFAEHVRGGPNLCPGDAGLAVQKILDGIYASARTGREVVLD